MQRPFKLFSFIALLVVLVIGIQTIQEQGKDRVIRTINWDVQEYYMYLPAFFIYSDPSFAFTDTLPKEQAQKFWLRPSDKNPIGRMTLGMAIMYSPLFLLAHAYAHFANYPLTGFSEPYQLAVFISGFLYAFIGFIFLRKTLLRFFSDGTTALTILCIGLGTNLFYYYTTEGGMTHATLFGLFSIFFYCTVAWHEQQKLKYVIPLAIAGALSILIRPTSVLIFIVFVLYGVCSKNTIRHKCELLKNNIWQIAALFGLMLLIALLQFSYWKWQTGHWVYYSYGEEGFFFSDPTIINGLFSYRKGWLVYTPVMIFALLGFLFYERIDKRLLYPILIYFVATAYVVFSWWCWWYGGSFGMRALIESYAFLAYPMAVFWAVAMKHWRSIIPLIAVAGFFIYLNQYQSKQYRQGIMHWDSMTKEYYWDIFLNMKIPPNAEAKLNHPDYEAAMQGER